MRKTDRSLIVAAATGLAGIGVGAGLALGGDWTSHPPNQGNKPYSSIERYILQKQDRGFAAYPLLESNRCYAAKDHDSADLCAQWRAAIASERSATHARWSTILGIFSLITSVIGFMFLWRSLRQTEEALGEARRSANFAGESHMAFMRVEDAYLVVNFHNGIADHSGTVPRISFQVTVTNIGRSPAVVDAITINQSHSPSTNSTNSMWETPVPPGPATTMPCRVVVGNPSGAGECFDGSIWYNTAIGGNQSRYFHCPHIAQDPDTSTYYASFQKRSPPGVAA